jgi:energy-coupling factor transport system permease protein
MSVIMIGIAIITLPNGPVIGTLIPEVVPVIGGAIPITLGGLTFGVIMALRFAVLVVAVQFFVISTRPRDLIHTLERLRVPVDFILMFVIALRFIPTLQIEGTRIQEAQLARGYDPGTGVGGKIQRFVPVMVPLVSNALSRANVLGLTIDIRGYRTRTRTRLREFPFQSLDYVTFFVMISILIGYILLIVKQII